MKQITQQTSENREMEMPHKQLLPLYLFAPGSIVRVCFNTKTNKNPIPPRTPGWLSFLTVLCKTQVIGQMEKADVGETTSSLPHKAVCSTPTEGTAGSPTLQRVAPRCVCAKSIRSEDACGQCLGSSDASGLLPGIIVFAG